MDALDIMPYMRQLEAAGFREELLDRAVALAGADRLIDRRLCSAVTENGLRPVEALSALERELPQ